jgi:hypothetical protein
MRWGQAPRPPKIFTSRKINIPAIYIMINAQYINDLLQNAQNELANLNSQISKTTDKILSKELMKHITAVNKLLTALHQYKLLDPPQESAKKKW